MPLILAIEPDRRQASQLTAIVRGRLRAELVLAESAERALSALGGRVPDLVLTSALLSPKDEALLADSLRSLDGKAAHVQALTIPMLATQASGGGRASGMLAALRRDKNRSASHEGCDPGVFADQCREYLERAESERVALLDRAARATAKETARPVSPSPVTGSEWVVVRDPEPDVATAPELIEASFVLPPPSAPVEVVEEPDEAFATPAVETVLSRELPAIEQETSGGVELSYDSTPSPQLDRVLREFLDLSATDAEGPASLLAAVAQLEAEQNYLSLPAHAPDPDESDQIAGGAATASDPVDEPAPLTAAPRNDDSDFVDLSSLLQSELSVSSDVTPEVDADAAVEVYEIDANALQVPLDMMSSSSEDSTGRSLATFADLEDIFKNTPEFAPTPAPQPAPNPDPPDLQEWLDIVEALRRDAEQLEPRQTGPSPAAPETGALPETSGLAVETAGGPGTEAEAAADVAEPQSPEPPAPKRKRRRAKHGPAQDEWGFFDPDQCGIAALIEKLEEITDSDEPPKRGA